MPKICFVRASILPQILAWLVSIGMLLGWVLPSPAAYAAIAQPERVPLTIELLQERLKNPIQRDGIRTIDLRGVVIDLRAEQADFRDQFYRQLQAQLLKTGNPVGLDLSYALVLGDLTMSELGLRAPLYGQAFSPIFSEAEQEQLRRDRRRLSQFSQLSRSLLIQAQPALIQITVFRGPLTLVQTRFEGGVNFTNTFFLGRVNGEGADFTQVVDCSEARFSQPVTFAGALFRGATRFRNAIFFNRVRFNQAQFQETVSLQSSEFQATANFNQALFQKTANLSRIQWYGNADFAQTRWQAVISFNRDNFAQALFLTEATFEHLVSFRQSRFNQPVNLRNASVAEQIDLGDAEFAKGAYLNVAGLQFSAEQARILGNPGEIGRYLSVPTLQGNETLLRNLVRNFRLLEQIADANALEFTTKQLKLQELRQQLLGINLNTATLSDLRRTGLSEPQAIAILQRRSEQSFRNTADLLKLDEIDLGTYVKVRDRVVAYQPYATWERLGAVWQWTALSLLVSLSRYGTSSGLVFGVGMIALAYFGVLFWLIDRVRRWRPTRIVPGMNEAIAILSTAMILILLGLSTIFRGAEHPWITLICLGLLVVPLPGLLVGLIYQRGRYHDLMTVSYFVEDGSMRQLRLLIGRLPNIPRYPFFRERYSPLLWDRGWGWLNYLDFSLNNLLKFGFNDIRLRDEHIPGLITALAWYQWILGMLYLTLLLWTLSRTIPGLNLLIYFK